MRKPRCTLPIATSLIFLTLAGLIACLTPLPKSESRPAPRPNAVLIDFSDPTSPRIWEESR